MFHSIRVVRCVLGCWFTGLWLFAMPFDFIDRLTTYATIVAALCVRVGFYSLLTAEYGACALRAGLAFTRSVRHGMDRAKIWWRSTREPSLADLRKKLASREETLLMCRMAGDVCARTGDVEFRRDISPLASDAMIARLESDIRDLTHEIECRTFVPPSYRRPANP